MNGPRRIVFLTDDQFGLWRKGDHGFDLGRESPAVPVWLIERYGETIALTDPFGRGLIRLADDDEGGAE
jgi:hypothetical protein